MITMKIILTFIFVFTSFLAHAVAYKGTNIQIVSNEAALGKCGYAPPRFNRQGREGRVMVYQYTCGSIFKLVSVACIAFENESKVDMEAIPTRDYRYGRFSNGQQSPVYVCQ